MHQLMTLDPQLGMSVRSSPGICHVGSVFLWKPVRDMRIFSLGI